MKLRDKICNPAESAYIHHELSFIRVIIKETIFYHHV